MNNIFFFLFLFTFYNTSAQDDGLTQSEVWPIPKFYFIVEFGSSGIKGSFQEISGLDTESQIIEYRAENDPRFSTAKMPGLVKSGNVVLKKGVFVMDDKFWNWYGAIKMNTLKRETVDLDSDLNEIIVETIEISHERLVIANH